MANTPKAEATLESPVDETASVEPAEAPTAPAETEHTTKLRGVIAVLVKARQALSDKVEAFKVATTTIEPVVAPLRVLDRNSENSSFAEAVAATIAAADKREAGLGAQIDPLISLVQHLVEKLDPGKLEFDFAPGDGAVALINNLKPMVPMFVDIDPLVMSAAETEAKEWAAAKQRFEAIGPKGYSPKNNNTDQRSGPGRKYRPTRGEGELWTNRHFRVVMTHECGDPLVSGSNKGSAQDQMANHIARHRNGPRSEVGPYADEQVHADFTRALNEVWDAPDSDTSISREGGEFTIRRDFNTVPAI